jgi:hypothetical protein
MNSFFNDKTLELITDEESSLQIRIQQPYVRLRIDRRELIRGLFVAVR